MGEMGCVVGYIFNPIVLTEMVGGAVNFGAGFAA